MNTTDKVGGRLYIMEQNRTRKAGLFYMKRFFFAVIICFAATAVARAATPGVSVPSATFFDYDATQPLNPTSEQLEDKQFHTEYRVEFNTTNGLRVPGLFYVPKKGRRPLPAILIMHGAGGSKQDFTMAYEFLAMRGFAVLAIDAALHGDRAAPGVDAFRADWLQLRAIYMQTVVDLRRAVDWLQSQDDIDDEFIGFWGVSMGTMIGTVFCAVEPRIHAAALLLGGADYHVLLRHSQLPALAIMRNYGNQEEMDTVAEQLAAVDPQYYIGAIAPRPVLLMNGERDYIISPEAGARLQELANEPKEIHWYDGGHLPPFDKVLMLSSDFFKKHLKRKQAPPKGPPHVDLEADTEITAHIDRDVSDPNTRRFTVTASAQPDLPEGVSLTAHFPMLSDLNLPMFDDGTHGDAAAGDGTWTMLYVLGPHPSALDVVGGAAMYEITIRAVGPDDAVLTEQPAGLLIEDTADEDK